MRINKFLSLEIVLLITAIVLGVFWIQNPSGNYEPYLAVIGLIMAALEILRRKSRETNKDDLLASDNKGNISELSVKEQAINMSRITVEEIVGTINSAPPFQKEEISKKYVGIKVKWIGYLREAKEDYQDKDSVRVNLNIDKNKMSGYSFWFTEKVSKFPEIRTLKSMSAIRVTGEIISASGEGLFVDLKPLAIEVVKDSPMHKINLKSDKEIRDYIDDEMKNLTLVNANFEQLAQKFIDASVDWIISVDRIEKDEQGICKVYFSQSQYSRLESFTVDPEAFPIVNFFKKNDKYRLGAKIKLFNSTTIELDRVSYLEKI